MGFEPMDALRHLHLSRVTVSTTHANLLSGMESQVGVEPTNSCFADSSLIRLGTATYIGVSYIPDYWQVQLIFKLVPDTSKSSTSSGILSTSMPSSSKETVAESPILEVADTSEVFGSPRTIAHLMCFGRILSRASVICWE